jgi:hypothetical protein
MIFRLLGLSDELRLQIEEASNGTITTEAARLLVEASVQQAQSVFDATLNNITKEVQGVIGPHGSITRLQAGGITISRGEGISVYADGVNKTTIDPRGNVIIGSDITQPATTTEIFFVEADAYNGESFGAGDLLIGDNSTGQSNVKWDASEGQLLFRTGTTAQAYMDTDGSLKAGGGEAVLDADGITLTPGTLDANKIKWATASEASYESNIYSDYMDPDAELWAECVVPATESSEIILSASSGGTKVAKISLQADSDGTSAIDINTEGHDVDTQIQGDTDSALVYVDASANRVGIGTATPAVKFDVNSDSIRVRTAKTPASATDTGVAGQIAWDANFIYICTATDTWKRVAIATW